MNFALLHWLCIFPCFCSVAPAQAFCNYFVHTEIYIYIYAFSRRFYPKRLTVHSGYTCCVCAPWELNPQPCGFFVNTIANHHFYFMCYFFEMCLFFTLQFNVNYEK